MDPLYTSSTSHGPPIWSQGTPCTPRTSHVRSIHPQYLLCTPGIYIHTPSTDPQDVPYIPYISPECTIYPLQTPRMPHMGTIHPQHVLYIPPIQPKDTLCTPYILPVHPICPLYSPRWPPVASHTPSIPHRPPITPPAYPTQSHVPPRAPHSGPAPHAPCM